MSVYICFLDFVSMNKDFQQFVSTTAATIHSSSLTGSSIENDAVMKLSTPNAKTLRDGLGDIISIIRYCSNYAC
ncbi:hypothetical protein EON65_19695 [archaeon]|nr:MAG: hypothetical protein EON65_19695 [archaeon]